MKQAFSRWGAIAILCALAVAFAGNHIAARFAFDNGANVTAAVLFRSIGTALALLVILKLAKISMYLPQATFSRAVFIGLLVAIQSFCIYSAVAKIPVALALLIFNIFSLFYTLLHWLINGVRPSNKTLAIFPVVLFGLSLALNPFGWGQNANNVRIINDPYFWQGVTYASLAALAFGLVLTLTERWMTAVDARLRTLVFMIVVGILAGASTLFVDLRVPQNAVGWAGLIGLTILYGTAFSSLFILMPRLNMPQNSAAMNFEPIATIALAWALLGQKLQSIQLLGALIVVGAIVAIGAINSNRAVAAKK